MARNYVSIGKEIALTGFFSEYLPPCFKLNENVLNYPPASECDLVRPLSFTMSRYNANDARRTIFIPEIGAYLAAHMYMKENDIYRELIEFTQTENYSFSPILGNDSSIMRHEQSYGGTGGVPSSEYIENIANKMTRAIGAKKILHLDISNCFSSFYMHMIPSIMLGAEGAEKEYDNAQKKKRDSSVAVDPIYERYSKLDEVVRRQNLNRTNGLLPGILSSKLIAEALLTRIDKELSAEGVSFVRYVDDYEVFLYENNEDEIISVFTSVLRKYGFSLNFEKSQIVEFPFYVVENFEKILDNKHTKLIEYADLIDIFNKFLCLEKYGTKGAIRYLLKTFEKYNVRVDDSELYKSYLITIMANEPRSLSKSCSILINNKEKYPITPRDKDIIISMLQKHLKNGNDLETIWLLYLLIETDNIHREDDVIKDILSDASELAIVILLRKGLVSEQNLEIIKTNANSWILLYELYQMDSIDETDFFQRLNIAKNKAMYRKLKEKKLRFAY